MKSLTIIYLAERPEGDAPVRVLADHGTFLAEMRKSPWDTLRVWMEGSCHWLVWPVEEPAKFCVDCGRDDTLEPILTQKPGCRPENAHVCEEHDPFPYRRKCGFCGEQNSRCECRQ